MTPRSGILWHDSRMSRRRSFGNIRRLPSGRYQARYHGPDGNHHRAPTTFTSTQDAEAWLSLQRADIIRATWESPAVRRAEQERTARAQVDFGDYAVRWLAGRDLRPRTRMLYDRIIELDLLPAFGDSALAEVTPAMVRQWWRGLPAKRVTGNAHAYSLLRTIMGTAVQEDDLATNPCRIPGAGQTKRQRRIEPATLGQLRAIADGMPEQWRLLVWLGAACALRIGETTELRRRDVDLRDLELPVLRIRRAVTYRNGQTIVGAPKSQAGSRDVVVPPRLSPMLVDHMEHHAQPGRDGLLFTGVRNAPGRCVCGHSGCVGGHLSATVLYGYWDAARQAAGRPDLRLHDLRHTGAVMAAQEGASLAELMGRLGHTTPAMALRYQHVAKGRDAEIARRMSTRWDA